MHQHINASTINASTHQCINTLTHQHNHQHINTIINASTHQRINASTQSSMHDLWEKKILLTLEKKKILSGGFWGNFHPLIALFFTLRAVNRYSSSGFSGIYEMLVWCGIASSVTSRVNHTNALTPRLPPNETIPIFLFFA
jgi:hypothetical protein